MYKKVAKKAVFALIPKLVNSLYSLVFSSKPKSLFNAKKQLSIPRKKSDMRAISKQQYDHIVEARIALQNFNIGKTGTERKSRAELVKVLNQELGLNKSETFYGEVWAGRKNREDLLDAPMHSTY